MTVWPRIFRSVERAQDLYDEPQDDRFDFALACWCYGYATRDETLAYWLPQIDSMCREHDRTARGLPMSRPRYRCKPGETAVRFDLGLTRADEHRPGWHRLAFRCGCLVASTTNPATGQHHLIAAWTCGLPHSQALLGD